MSHQVLAVGRDLPSCWLEHSPRASLRAQASWASSQYGSCILPYARESLPREPRGSFMTLQTSPQKSHSITFIIFFWLKLSQTPWLQRMVKQTVPLDTVLEEHVGPENDAKGIVVKYTVREVLQRWLKMSSLYLRGWVQADEPK